MISDNICASLPKLTYPNYMGQITALWKKESVKKQSRHSLTSTKICMQVILFSNKQKKRFLEVKETILLSKYHSKLGAQVLQ